MGRPQETRTVIISLYLTPEPYSDISLTSILVLLHFGNQPGLNQISKRLTRKSKKKPDLARLSSTFFTITNHDTDLIQSAPFSDIVADSP